MGKLKKKIWLSLLLVAAILYIIIYIVPGVTGLFTATYSAEYGELKTYDETEMFFVRNETVYTAASAGTVNRLAEEGRLVRGNTTVIEVSGSGSSDTERYADILDRLGKAAVSTESFVAEDGGVISYYADGYEGELTPETMGNKSYDYYQALSQESVKELSDGKIAKGDPVYKIIDKSKWYATAFVPDASKDRYSEGKSVDVQLGDINIPMTVTAVKDEGDMVRLTMETTRYYEKYGGLRRASVTIVTADAAGLVIENASMVEEDGVRGVYVKDKKNRYEFTPVNVLLTDGTRSVISDSFFYDAEGARTATVRPHDDVLKEPDDAKK